MNLQCTDKQYVYAFGQGQAAGDATQRTLLGGKGANLAEMSKIGLPVPAGFTISTECCVDFLGLGGCFPDGLQEQVTAALRQTETIMGMVYGDPDNPLLVSCRSGARSSMPGMMETVLNVGLSPQTIPGLIRKTGNPRFVWDAYRRLIMMYADVVMEKSEGIDPPEGGGIRRQLELLLHTYKEAKGLSDDTDLSEKDLEVLADQFRERILTVLGKPFPDDPVEQLWGAVGAVFKSWNGRRAVSFRRIENIPDSWGTAVTVQSMVFGNMGNDSATGVAFTRDPATGQNVFYGEWLPNAQGEDVVAGIRTPNPLNEIAKNDQNRCLPSLEQRMPDLYASLCKVRDQLEQHYRDMQDIEFTIQQGHLYILQCRSGKRTGQAAIAMAMDMLNEKLIDEQTVVMRIDAGHLDQLLHPFVDPKAEKRQVPIAAGLPAGPGGATGCLVFDPHAAVKWSAEGRKVILAREETNPEDIEGMRVAEGILTARGGMTSHAALVARGWGKCCIVGAGKIKVNPDSRCMTIGDKHYAEGEVVTLNGTRGLVYSGELPMVDASENPKLIAFMHLTERFRKLGVRANADTPEDARVALAFGAEGIGLFRTEHMFYGFGSDEPLFLLRKMIFSSGRDARIGALDALFSYFKQAVSATLSVMDGLPVTIRLLDPPLHEFVPHSVTGREELAAALNVSVDVVRERISLLRESNPMMGHRGVRLGVTFPEITEMQARAIFEAAVELADAGKPCCPEIMIPVTCDARELHDQKIRITAIHDAVCKTFNRTSINYRLGTMIEIPRACLQAGDMAGEVDFFSFGTNDLTQMTFGFSRDDIGSFLPMYLQKNILDDDPFQTLDRKGVGKLIDLAVRDGRAKSPALKVGICGEHGGDPRSIQFCHQAGLNYVSCSPYRVPIARLAAAQAAILSASADSTAHEDHT